MALAVERDTHHLPDAKLSMSRVRAFQSCPACFELEYILKRPRRTHIALPIGGAVHEGVQLARLAVMADAWTERIVASAVDLAVTEFEQEVKKIQPEDLDLGSAAYMAPADALKDVEALTWAAVTQVVEGERRVGIAAVEARVDFESVFPFFFDAYADVLLKDGTLKDLKTSRKKVDPDAWAKIQLLVYGLPWHLAGQPIQLQIDQVTMATKTQLQASVQYHAVESGPVAFKAAEKLVLDTAAAISTGLFPPRPGYWCRFDHGFGT